MGSAPTLSFISSSASSALISKYPVCETSIAREKSNTQLASPFPPDDRFVDVSARRLKSRKELDRRRGLASSLVNSSEKSPEENPFQHSLPSIGALRQAGSRTLQFQTEFQLNRSVNDFGLESTSEDDQGQLMDKSVNLRRRCARI